MRDDQRQKMLDQIQNMFANLDTRCYPTRDITFCWAEEGTGFGELTFYTTAEDDKLHCSNEAMSKECIKKMLCQMVDECVLDDPPLKKDDS